MPEGRPVTFNDPIHGTIQLHWLLGKIINTPEFQRLHHIKQLSSTFRVYPEAKHTRFGHSIGTAHLAGRLVKHLQQQQPELEIDDIDVLCVQMAGLCHDLGHGPYSHLFDDQFLPMIGIDDWKHEECSRRMFDKIVDRLRVQNNQNPAIGNFFVNTRCKFIKEMIDPSHNGDYQGLNEDKHFLFQIISNKTSGVDVDKWDYFARDCHHLGIANSFNHERFIRFTRVIAVPADGDRKHICAMKKEAFNLYGMFRARFALHKRACQHKRKNAIDHMICDALFKAYEHVDVDGVRGIQNCINPGQEEAFCHLDDRILLKIEQATNIPHREMRRAKEILTRISNNDHYFLIGERPLYESFCSKKDKRTREREIKRILESLDQDQLAKKIRVTIATFNYGMGHEDPINKVWFYTSDNEDTAIRVKREDVSRLLPAVFEENILQVFCTDASKRDRAKEAFEKLRL